MSNVDIRSYAVARGVKLYEVAKRLRVSESTMTRIMRGDLPTQKKQEILQIIDQLAEGKCHG